MSMPVIPNSYLPIILAFAMLFTALGAGGMLHDQESAVWLFLFGVVLLLAGIYKWFQRVVLDGQTLLSGNKVFDQSMRIGMIWFIFTEVMFFAALFGVLFYIRVWVLPQLGGLVPAKVMTHTILWPDFQATWPLQQTPDGTVKDIQPVLAMGIPAFNTIILLLSGVTITISHHYLYLERYMQSARWLLTTVALGVFFLIMQFYEYAHAISSGFTHQSGIYGNIFYFMTGFHGLHVLIGSVILFVMYLRMKRGHFSADSHFGFEASAWYWHFVDVVWLMLFVFVYWI
jgi:cytochrome c oxidase subunit 3